MYGNYLFLLLFCFFIHSISLAEGPAISPSALTALTTKVDDHKDRGKEADKDSKKNPLEEEKKLKAKNMEKNAPLLKEGLKTIEERNNLAKTTGATEQKPLSKWKTQDGETIGKFKTPEGEVYRAMDAKSLESLKDRGVVNIDSTKVDKSGFGAPSSAPASSELVNSAGSSTSSGASPSANAASTQTAAATTRSSSAGSSSAASGSPSARRDSGASSSPSPEVKDLSTVSRKVDSIPSKSAVSEAKASTSAPAQEAASTSASNAPASKDQKLFNYLKGDDLPPGFESSSSKVAQHTPETSPTVLDRMDPASRDARIDLIRLNANSEGQLGDFLMAPKDVTSAHGIPRTPENAVAMERQYVLDMARNASEGGVSLVDKGFDAVLERQSAQAVEMGTKAGTLLRDTANSLQNAILTNSNSWPF